MNLSDIAVVILTRNETANISRTLSRLRWASEVVVVDSFSDDDTVEIASSFENVRVVQRKFDAHAIQWNFAVHDTGIDRPWILALDADYLVTDAFVGELERCDTLENIAGLRANFVYCIDGKPLRGSLYPPVTVLYRREKGKYVQDGHTQRLVVDGAVQALGAKLQHDDRKPLSHWLGAQDRYMTLEADLLRTTPRSELGLADRIRKLPGLSPIVVLFYVLFAKGAILDGRAGWTYAMQRFVAEGILTLKLLQK